MSVNVRAAAVLEILGERELTVAEIASEGSEWDVYAGPNVVRKTLRQLQEAGVVEQAETFDGQVGRQWRWFRCVREPEGEFAEIVAGLRESAPVPRWGDGG